MPTQNEAQTPTQRNSQSDKKISEQCAIGIHTFVCLTCILSVSVLIKCFATNKSMPDFNLFCLHKR